MWTRVLIHIFLIDLRQPAVGCFAVFLIQIQVLLFPEPDVGPVKDIDDRENGTMILTNERFFRPLQYPAGDPLDCKFCPEGRRFCEGFILTWVIRDAKVKTCETLNICKKLSFIHGIMERRIWMKYMHSEWQARLEHWMETLKKDLYLPLGPIEVDAFLPWNT